MYDWANSVYSLVITSTIFPIYYGAVTLNEATGNEISFFGWQVKNTVLFSYAISFSFLFAGLLGPLLSGLADYSGLKKRFMQFFCYLGAFSCCGLFFFTKETVEISMLLFVLATIGFSGSIVFYNAFLPEIASTDKLDEVSARGFSLGYIGSVLLLVANLLPILQPGWFGGISSGMASRISFLATGLWWMGFAQIPFFHLPQRKNAGAKGNGIISKGFVELKKVWLEVQTFPALKRFLMAYFFYNMGVQTVMYLATLFGDQELKLSSSSLIITILILQLVAVAGARLFAMLSKIKGNIPTLLLAILVWMGICFGAYFTYTENQFFVLAAVVGLVMGGIQSLSRSTFAKYIPAQTKDTASYFSFYDITEKLAIVIGTASYGLVESLTGSMRNASLFLCLYFLTGFLILLSLQKSLATKKA